MKTRNKLLTLLILSSGAAAATALINKAIKLSATSRNVLEEPEALCYKWRLGNIHYTKTGTGKPILLVHDLAPASSGFEWKNLVGKLSETYTVYTIDLLGFGRSEKPNLTYTNYLYVQLISDFYKIRDRTQDRYDSQWFLCCVGYHGLQQQSRIIQSAFIHKSRVPPFLQSGTR